MVTTTSTTVLKTRIAYYPSEEDGVQFKTMLPSTTASKAGLPAGYPVQLNSPLVWKGSDLQSRTKEWIVQLSEQDTRSIDAALKHFQELNLAPTDITQKTFPLPDSLAHTLAAVSEQCYGGLGFCIIRGLNPDRYTTFENILLYTGLSAYVAPQRGFQDKERTEVLCHVFNRVLLEDAVKERETPAFTEGAMSFHTDLGEILSLYTLEVDEAGQLLLASAWQIYNELAASRPDLVRTLSQDWIWDTFTDYEKLPPIKMPLMAYHDGKLITHCSRYPLTGFGSFQRNPDLPPITDEQMEALNAIHFIAKRNAIQLPNVKGDLLYVNNMALLHGRQALKKADGHAKLSARHRLKFFLRDPSRSWQVPQGFQRIWTHLYGSNTDNGTREEKWILEPERKVSRKWMVNG